MREERQGQRGVEKREKGGSEKKATCRLAQNREETIACTRIVHTCMFSH